MLSGQRGNCQRQHLMLPAKLSAWKVGDRGVEPNFQVTKKPRNKSNVLGLRPPGLEVLLARSAYMCLEPHSYHITVYYILRCTYSVYFKSKKKLNYDRFVDPNILGAARHVHSHLRIYRISFFLVDLRQFKLRHDLLYCFNYTLRVDFQFTVVNSTVCFTRYRE